MIIPLAAACIAAVVWADGVVTVDRECLARTPDKKTHVIVDTAVVNGRARFIVPWIDR